MRVYDGTELTSRVLDHWTYWVGVSLEFGRSAKPVDSCFIETFSGTVQRERLSQHWFLDLEGAQRTLDSWREGYDNT